MRIVWAWLDIHEVLFKPWKKARPLKPNPEMYFWKKELTDHKEISKNIKEFCDTLFKRDEKQRFLNSLSTKTLTNEQYDLCENKISETDLFDSMKSMKNNKTLGTDELTKEFYKTSGMNWKLLLYKV